MAFVESEVVELKAEVVGDICKEVIAFANTKGGTRGRPELFCTVLLLQFF